MSQKPVSMRIRHRMQWCQFCHTKQALFLCFTPSPDGHETVFEGECLECRHDFGISVINTLCGCKPNPNQPPRPPLDWARLHICPKCVSSHCLGWYRGNNTIAFECYDCGHFFVPSYLPGNLGSQRGIR